MVWGICRNRENRELGQVHGRDRSGFRQSNDQETWSAKAECEAKTMIKPLFDRVVVKPDIRKISDIIYINNREPFNEGTIVAIGPEVDQAAVGDRIKYGNGDYLNWPTHKIDGQDYQIIQEADICAVMEE
jgi:co-chaperonin GroES (HSP10)